MKFTMNNEVILRKDIIEHLEQFTPGTPIERQIERAQKIYEWVTEGKKDDETTEKET